ncbi:MAG: bifunctional adenosylcobinamide kinase/adenosylcobinamide-phosphate guanylyltransferase, partial [Desulfocucumaceae bacterium]
TSAPGDEEMIKRVDLHRLRRPVEWKTIEETHNVPQRIEEASEKVGVLLVDSLTGWLSNLLVDEMLPAPGASATEKEEYIASRVGDLAHAAGRFQSSLVVVTDEVGLGLVPTYPLGRLFRDVMGKANSRLAAVADEVYLVVAGMALEIKGLAVNKEKL